MTFYLVFFFSEHSYIKDKQTKFRYIIFSLRFRQETQKFYNKKYLIHYLKSCEILYFLTGNKLLNEKSKM
jgi:hypothetical protein